MRRLILFLIIFLILLPAAGCYAHGPWRGKVIESDTKKPIEGAVVVAVWYSKLFYPWAVGGMDSDPMKVVEKVTDANGEFYFSSKYFLDLPVLREVSGPDFLIYKPGYGASGASSVTYYLLSNPTYNKKYKEFAPLYNNELAIIELPRLENKKDREKAYESAGEFRLDITRETPLMKKFINQERKNLGWTGEVD